MKHIHIYQTNIKKRKKVRALKSLFKNNNDIYKWNLDFDDQDKVLRIESKQNEIDLCFIPKNYGIVITELTW